VLPVAAARGDHDDVVAVGEVGERRPPLLAGLAPGVDEEDLGRVEGRLQPPAADPHQHRVDLAADVDEVPGDRAMARRP
jgi:hypothetical protein